MPYENINAILPDATVQSIQAHLSDSMQALPFLVNLTPKERKQKGPQARRRDIYAITCHEIAKNEPMLVPPTIDMAGWENDLDLINKLSSLKRQVAQLYEALDDTVLALKAETSMPSDLFYKTLKLLSKTNVPGVNVMVDRLTETKGNVGGRKKKQ